MTNHKIFFDGTEISKSDYEQLSGFTVTERLGTDSDAGIATGFGSTFKFKGAAYDYIKNQILCKPYPAIEYIGFSIVVVCKDGTEKTVFEGAIYGADIEYTTGAKETCTLTVSPKQDDVRSQALSCLKNVIITQRSREGIVTNGEDEFRSSPYYDYCENPSILSIVLYSTLIQVFTIFDVIIAALNLIPGVDISFDPLGYLFDTALGCGKKHKAPFIHSYLSNISKLCGLTLQSSIFGVGGDYHNLTRLDCQFSASSENIAAANTIFRERNFPNLNGVQFLSSLKEFAIKWFILDGILYVEREDFLPTGPTYDLTSAVTEISITDDTPPAYSDYSYTLDGDDKAGDRANPDYVSKGAYIDWNVPINPALSGSKKRQFLYGTPIFRSDLFNERMFPIDDPIFTIIPTISAYLGAYLNVLVLEKGTATLPKLIMYDPLSDINAARAQRLAVPNTDLFLYNWAMIVRPFNTYAQVSFPYNLYTSLLNIDDPRTSPIKQRDFVSTTTFCCDDFSDYIGRTCTLSDACGTRTGVIMEAEYDFLSSQIKLKGKA